MIQIPRVELMVGRPSSGRMVSAQQVTIREASRTENLYEPIVINVHICPECVQVQTYYTGWVKLSGIQHIQILNVRYLNVLSLVSIVMHNIYLEHDSFRASVCDLLFGNL